jgi:hypothetical protein
VRLDHKANLSVRPGLVFRFRLAQFDVNRSCGFPLLADVSEFGHQVRAGAGLALPTDDSRCGQRLVQMDDTSRRGILTGYPLQEIPRDFRTCAQLFGLEVVSA